MPTKHSLARILLGVVLAGSGTDLCAWAADATPSFTLPAYQKVSLPNGLTLYLMERHDVPMITVSCVFPAGAVCDGDRYGLAALTAESLLLGTRGHTKQQIEEQLDFIGASCWASASEDAADLSMSFVNTDQDKVLPLLKEIVCSPRFDGQEINKRKRQWLVDLARDKERPAEVIQPYFDRFLFGTHAYGNPVSGTPATVSRITTGDVKAFYQAHYDPNGSAVAVVGDFNTPAMRQAVTTLLQDWRPKASRHASLDRPTVRVDRNKVLLVNKDDATETRFLIGGPGVTRDNPDYVEIQVVNTILGGRFTSWLNDELRVNRGLTYGARSGFRPFKHAGTFAISSFTKTEHTQEALTVSIEVLNRLHTQGVDQATLTSAKNYLSGQFPTHYETAGSLAALLTDMFVYGFDETYVNTFLQRVRDLTPEKAQHVIETYFPKEHLQFVLIGKASSIREAAKAFGELTEKDIRTPGF